MLKNRPRFCSSARKWFIQILCTFRRDPISFAPKLLGRFGWKSPSLTWIVLSHVNFASVWFILGSPIDRPKWIFTCIPIVISQNLVGISCTTFCYIGIRHTIRNFPSFSFILIPMLHKSLHKLICMVHAPLQIVMKHDLRHFYYTRNKFVSFILWPTLHKPKNIYFGRILRSCYLREISCKYSWNACLTFYMTFA
jgi:hypothetical protein